MGEADQAPRDPEPLRAPQGLAVEGQLRCLPILASDLDVAEPDPPGPPRSQGLEAGLLGGKTSGERLEPVPPPAARFPLGRGEDPRLEMLAVPLQSRRQAVDLDDVDADSGDHGSPRPGPRVRAGPGVYCISHE